MKIPTVDRECVRGLKVPTLLLYGANTHLAQLWVGMKRLVRRSCRFVLCQADGLWNQKPEECRDAVLRFLAGK